MQIELLVYRNVWNKGTCTYSEIGKKYLLYTDVCLYAWVNKDVPAHLFVLGNTFGLDIIKIGLERNKRTRQLHDKYTVVWRKRIAHLSRSPFLKLICACKTINDTYYMINMYDWVAPSSEPSGYLQLYPI